MEKTRSKNYIQINIGGQIRRLTIGMRVSEFIASEIPKGVEGFNMHARYIKVMYIGLKNPQNSLPENYSEDVVVEWIDSMSMDEWEVVRGFIDESLGFIVADYINSIERMAKSIDLANLV
jgi:hypothetical protein